MAFPNKLDSLKKTYSLGLPDDKQANHLYNIALRSNTNDSSEKYYLLAFQKANEFNNSEIKALTKFQLAKIKIEQKSLAEALKYAKEAVGFANKKIKASLLNRLAAVYFKMEDYANALATYNEALINNGDIESKGLANVGIGSINYLQGNYTEAISYYKNAIAFYDKIEYIESKAEVLSNLGRAYSGLMNYQEAINSYNKSIEIYDKIKLFSDKAMVLMNLGNEYLRLNNLTEAKKYFNESIQIFEEQKDKRGIALNLINLTTAAYKEKKYVECETYLNKALFIAKSLNNFELKKTCYEYFSDLYSTTQDYKSAHKYALLYSSMKDSLNERLYNDRIAQQETLQKTREKEAEIERQNIENKGLKTRQYLFVAISILGFIIIVVIFFQYKQKQKINKALEAKNKAIHNQKQEIENQSRVLEIQNKEITDSINYALQIQNAIFPKPEFITKNFVNHFILYQPKSVVSGDFYFYTETPDKFIFAAVDCTGHGVPGALMSMIGNNLLNQIIIEKNIVEPDVILSRLNKGVQKVLQQDEQSNSRDGMDIALIAFNKDKTKLEYAGANRPLYILRDKKLMEIKSDKSAIGGYQTDTEKQFTNHQIELMKGDTIYMFSDGYADQFGGAKGKKLMVKTLQQLLISIVDFDMDIQKQKLASYFTNWKGANEQIDDVLLIGIKV